MIQRMVCDRQVFWAGSPDTVAWPVMPKRLARSTASSNAAPVVSCQDISMNSYEQRHQREGDNSEFQGAGTTSGSGSILPQLAAQAHGACEEVGIGGTWRTAVSEAALMRPQCCSIPSGRYRRTFGAMQYDGVRVILQQCAFGDN